MFAPHFEQNIEEVASKRAGMQASYRIVSEIAITLEALEKIGSSDHRVIGKNLPRPMRRIVFR
jgi:hypothetical protein